MPESPQQASAPSTKIILVVEDDREIRSALLELLMFEGYQVYSASDGQQALDFLRNGIRPDLILLDLMMPVKSGTQFREEQMKDPKISNIPVIILSADSNIQKVSETLQVFSFLKKPVNLEELIVSVQLAI